jgi:hypothetical protein
MAIEVKLSGEYFATIDLSDVDQGERQWTLGIPSHADKLPSVSMVDIADVVAAFLLLLEGT